MRGALRSTFGLEGAVSEDSPFAQGADRSWEHLLPTLPTLPPSGRARRLAWRPSLQLGETKLAIKGCQLNRERGNSADHRCIRREAEEAARPGRTSGQRLVVLEVRLRRVSGHGRMMATMLAGIAQFERDLISERVKSGLAAARARGSA